MRTIAQTGRAIHRLLNNAALPAHNGLCEALDNLKIQGEKKIRDSIEAQKSDIQVGFDWDVNPIIRAVRENSF